MSPMSPVQTLSLLAIVCAVFLVMFGAFHMRKAGWSSLLLGLLGAVLLLLVAAYSPALIAVGDRLLQASHLPLMASAHAAAPALPATSTPHVVRQAGSHSTTRTVQQAHIRQQTTQHATQTITLDTFLPVAQWLLGSLLLGTILFIAAIMAIQRSRDRSRTVSTTCPRCLERRHHLAKYAWHTQEGKTSGLLCARCAQQLEAVELS
jgi:ABC-type multidrug transport system fused ATPase/permease subunit